MAATASYRVAGREFQNLADYIADLVAATRIQARIAPWGPLRVRVHDGGELLTIDRRRLQ